MRHRQRYALIAASLLLLLGIAVGGDRTERVRASAEPSGSVAGPTGASDGSEPTGRRAAGLAAPERPGTAERSTPGSERTRRLGNREPRRHTASQSASSAAAPVDRWPAATPGADGAGAIAPALARDPLPPFIRPAAGRGGERLLRVTPRESSGAIVVADTDGVVFGRHPLQPTPWAIHRGFELSVAPATGETSVLVAHELEDGRRSPWRPVSTPEGDR